MSEDREQLEFRFKLDEKFVKVMSHWLHDGTAASMGGNAFLVLCFIRSFVGAKGTNARPSQIRISKALKINIKTVRRCIDKLSDLGFVKTEQTTTKDGKRNEYYLTELVLAKSQNKELHGDAILEVPFGYGERKRVEPTLKLFETSGKLPPNSVVRVVNNITINMPVLLGEKSSATFNIAISSPEELSGEHINKKWMKEYYERAHKAALRAGESFEKELQIEMNGLENAILTTASKNSDKN